MRWITRERPKIDRIACPWLIQRSIDPEAQFLYVPADAVFRVAEQTGAIPYDIPGAELSHVDELCSFDTLDLREFLATTTAGVKLAALNPETLSANTHIGAYYDTNITSCFRRIP